MGNNKHTKPLVHAFASLVLLLCLYPSSLSAQQRIHAFISSGMTVNQIEGDELKGFRHYGYTGGVGALASISKNNRWGLSAEALFSQRGSRSNNDTRYFMYRTKITLNYVDIPIMVHFQDPYGGMLFGLGLNYGRLVQQPHGTMGFDTLFFVPDTTDMTFLQSDWGIVADARFTIWRGLQLGFRWQYSLAPIKRDWHFYKYKGLEYNSNGDPVQRWETRINNCYNHSISVRLIYQF